LSLGPLIHGTSLRYVFSELISCKGHVCFWAASCDRGLSRDWQRDRNLFFFDLRQIEDSWWHLCFDFFDEERLDLLVIVFLGFDDGVLLPEPPLYLPKFQVTVELFVLQFPIRFGLW